MGVDLRGQLQRGYRAIETGDVTDVDEFIAPDWMLQHERFEPAAARQAGPNGFAAMVEWLRSVYSDLAVEVHECTVDDDQVIAYVTLRGRQTGPLVLRTGDSVRVFPPSRRRFAVEHVHLARFDERGRALTYDAVRDDLELLAQLGHVPPDVWARWLRFAWAITGRRAAIEREFGGHVDAERLVAAG